MRSRPNDPQPRPRLTLGGRTLRGTSVSVQAPDDWRVESSDLDDVLEIRWHGSGVESGRQEVAAYLLLQAVELRRREALEDFGERMVREFMSAKTPDQPVSLENENVIKDFHGVTALSIDVVAGGYLPYRMRNLYWISGGKGYMISCYATAGSFEDRLPAFERMLKSIRFTR